MTTVNTAVPVTVPVLGDAVTEATITRWLKSVGDAVDLDEPLLEVATDKVDTEIPSPAAGILAEILETEDTVVKIGATVGRLDPTGSAPTPPPQPKPVALPVEQPPPASHPGPAAPIPAGQPQPTPAPATAPAPAGAPASSVEPSVRVEKLPRIRQTIARRMVESLQIAAQLTTVVEVDLTNVAALRTVEKDDFRARTGVKLSFLPFIVAAAVEALAHHPIVNASVNHECTEVTYHGAVHLGIAVDSDRGLMVPVIRNAEQQSIAEISRSIAVSAAAVRDGTIRPDDLSGGTFTITNTGSRGALFDTPIINQPQSAILGIGTVAERLVPQRDSEGNLVVHTRWMAYLALSYDHRIVDGADAARYLTAVRARLESGYSRTDLLR